MNQSHHEIEKSNLLKAIYLDLIFKVRLFYLLKFKLIPDFKIWNIIEFKNEIKTHHAFGHHSLLLLLLVSIMSIQNFKLFITTVFPTSVLSQTYFGKWEFKLCSINHRKIKSQWWKFSLQRRLWGTQNSSRVATHAINLMLGRE